MGEVAGEDAIGGVWVEGFILEAAWSARALALRFGRVASQTMAPAANVTPIARPILKSFCISPTLNTHPSPFGLRRVNLQYKAWNQTPQARSPAN